MGTILYWIGDSTVKRNNITRYPQTGIGQMFSLFLKPEISLKNLAENGRSTKSFLDEGRFLPVEESIKEGDYLFIQFGHNDEKKNDPERFTEPFGEYRGNLLHFIRTARERGANPLLITPLYRRLFQEDGRLAKNCHLDYPEAMKAVAVETNTPLIDLCTLSRSTIEHAGQEVSASWFMNLPKEIYHNYPEGLVDNTHLQPRGAIIFGSLIADGLLQLGGGYKELLVPLEKDDSYFSLVRQ